MTDIRSMKGNPFEAPRAVFVVGPTASGKSEFAYRLAKKHGGVIISADSMQIYRGLDIGTAKESAARRAEVPHEMIDVVDRDAEFSVAEYAARASECAVAAQRDGRLPIVAGGTGLYIESLLYPMRFGTACKNPALRGELETEAKAYGADALYERLKSLDGATAARLHANDVKRVVRALEIVLTTGRPMSDAADEKKEGSFIMVAFTCADRSDLYARINSRVDEMIAAGLSDEVRRTAGDFSCQSMQAIGYKEFASVADELRRGDLSVNSLNAVAEQIKRHTRNYAKRQLTWFRRYGFAEWFEAGDFDGASEYVESRLDEKRQVL